MNQTMMKLTEILYELETQNRDNMGRPISNSRLEGQVATSQALIFHFGLSDQEAATVMGTSRRTIYNYRHARRGSNVTPWEHRTKENQDAAIERAAKMMSSDNSSPIRESNSDIEKVIDFLSTTTSNEGMNLAQYNLFDRITTDAFNEHYHDYDKRREYFEHEVRAWDESDVDEFIRVFNL